MLQIESFKVTKHLTWWSRIELAKSFSGALPPLLFAGFKAFSSQIKLSKILDLSISQSENIQRHYSSSVGLIFIWPLNRTKWQLVADYKELCELRQGLPTSCSRRDQLNFWLKICSFGHILSYISQHNAVLHRPCPGILWLQCCPRSNLDKLCFKANVLDYWAISGINICHAGHGYFTITCLQCEGCCFWQNRSNLAWEYRRSNMSRV